MSKKQYRKLKTEIKDEIRKAFQEYGKSGVPEDALLRLCADHAIGLLQLPKKDVMHWYEGKGTIAR